MTIEQERHETINQIFGEKYSLVAVVVLSWMGSLGVDKLGESEYGAKVADGNVWPAICARDRRNI